MGYRDVAKDGIKRDVAKRGPQTGCSERGPPAAAKKATVGAWRKGTQTGFGEKTANGWCRKGHRRGVARGPEMGCGEIGPQMCGE